MSLRTILLSVMLTVSMLAIVIMGVLGVTTISRSVKNEAQRNVNQTLNIATSLYHQELTSLAETVYETIDVTALQSDDSADYLQRLKQQYGLTVLNHCDARGNPIAGSYGNEEAAVPVTQDSVIRKSLEGDFAFGTVLLDAQRLQLEGGPALLQAMSIQPEGQKTEALLQSALFWWLALPLRDDEGRITGVVYGGRALNYNFNLVDELRRQIFTGNMYEGKPRGTVTVFLGEVRVATNVLGPDRERAVGTKVSQEVSERVFEEGQPYYGRAWVVDAWYLSGYTPLQDLDGRIIGMLYVGLLEAPYNNMKMELIMRYIIPALGLLVITAGLSVWVVPRITKPLQKLEEASSHIAEGRWDIQLDDNSEYLEIRHLSSTFKKMQEAIAQRDRQVRSQNRRLAQTNEQLEKANRNYMQMLGFVTHELKAPLATIQTIIFNILDGFLGEVPERLKHYLIRIQRNCEDLQDMVKNYLDLSRAERGELIAEKNDIDFFEDVLEPCVQHIDSLLQSRKMTLEVNRPDSLGVHADAELMRIALGNYLTNAAKYGREEGQIKLKVDIENGDAVVSVWNEGEGFTSAEKEHLFGKFSRLKNKNTRDKKGSGLGLFLCQQILEQHKGTVWAESEPGQWACFYLRFPVSDS